MWTGFYCLLLLAVIVTDGASNDSSLVLKNIEDNGYIFGYIFLTLEKRDHNLEKTVEWTTIARRQDGSVDFNRNWTEYQNGFGNPDGEFFIGLEKLHNLTTQGAPQELLIVMKNLQNEESIAKYDNFKIGNAEEKYKLLELGEYSGDAGNYLRYNMKFSTYDNDNRNGNNSILRCVSVPNGGWWYHACLGYSLFGRYDSVNGFKWGYRSKFTQMRFVEMKIRPKL